MTDNNQDQTAPDQTDLQESAADIEAAIAEARARLADVPAEVVVTNHVMGLYELAAIHLSSSPPDLRGASLAIDAVALLVEGLGDRLGEEAETMQAALGNIRLAYVSVQSQANENGSSSNSSQ